jgi:sugar/nucleoside kinase (ribokinase family)
VKIYKLEKLYIKKGELGCTVINSNGSGRDFETTPVKSDNLTGCGDAFNTGVIFGELNNWELGKIAMYAMGLAYKVAKYGFIPNKII